MIEDKGMWLWKGVSILMFIATMLIIAVLHPIVGAIYEIIDLTGLLMFSILLIIIGYSVIFGKDRSVMRETPIKIVAIIMAVLLIGPFVLPELDRETSFVLLKTALGIIMVVMILVFCSFLPSLTKEKEGRRHPKPRPA